MKSSYVAISIVRCLKPNENFENFAKSTEKSAVVSSHTQLCHLGLSNMVSRRGSPYQSFTVGDNDIT
jgi:hypothetical protein